MDLEFSPKEREALVNYGIEALKSLMELFKASTELVKIESQFAKEALEEEKAKRDRNRRN
jgi:hypothetical protein